MSESKAVCPPSEAKERLLEGNRRFVKGEPAPKDTGKARRKELLEKGQRPFAAVLCCSDSPAKGRR